MAGDDINDLVEAAERAAEQEQAIAAEVQPWIDQCRQYASRIAELENARTRRPPGRRTELVELIDALEDFVEHRGDHPGDCEDYDDACTHHVKAHERRLNRLVTAAAPWRKRGRRTYRVGPRLSDPRYGALGGMSRGKESGPSWLVEQAEENGVTLWFAHGSVGTELYFSEEDAYDVGNALLRNSTYGPPGQPERPECDIDITGYAGVIEGMRRAALMGRDATAEDVVAHLRRVADSWTDSWADIEAQLEKERRRVDKLDGLLESLRDATLETSWSVSFNPHMDGGRWEVRDRHAASCVAFGSTVLEAILSASKTRGPNDG